MRYLKKLLLPILLTLYAVNLYSQCLVPSEPYLYASPDGTGDGLSYSSPTDLQSGLDMIQPGYTLWLLGGIYNGRYHTKYTSNEATEDCPITVSSYPGEWAVLNGNAECITVDIPPADFDNCGSILVVTKNYIEFKNFEITMLGDFQRDYCTGEDCYQPLQGISHLRGNFCKFINLIIRNTTVGAIASWNSAGGAEIYGCLVYNNGRIGHANGLGSDNSFYLQNSTDHTKIIENNIVFNSYKLGINIQTYGANNPTNMVRNFDVINNAVFNSAAPAYGNIGKQNLKITSRDHNPAHGPINIKIIDNALYHNARQINSGNNYQYSSFRRSLTIGHYTHLTDSYPNNIKIDNNLIVGGEGGLDFNAPKDISFTNNIVYSLRVKTNDAIDESVVPNVPFIETGTWYFSNNEYYTFNGNSFWYRPTSIGPSTPAYENYPFEDPSGTYSWQDTFSLDEIGSTWDVIGNCEYKYHTVTQNKYNHNVFKVVVSYFDNDENNYNVPIDFSSYTSALLNAPYYQIRDVENYNTVWTSGNVVEGGYSLNFDTNLTDFEYPTGTINGLPITGTGSFKTNENFGVFLVEFSKCEFDIILDGITESSDIEYPAVNSITVSPSTYYNINSSSNVVHKAGESIKLLPGFHAIYGSTYSASIEPCITDIDYIEQIENKASNNLEAESSNLISEEYDMVKVLPNPSSNTITIHSTKDITNYELLDQLNTVFISGEIKINNTKEFELDISRLKTGIYFLRITLVNGEVITKQVIKK